MKAIKFFLQLLGFTPSSYAQDEDPVYVKETHNTGINFSKLGLGSTDGENFVTGEGKKDPPPTKTAEELAAEAAAAAAAAQPPEVKEVEVTGELTKEQAIELTKDLGDEDEVEAPDGKKYTKKDFLATFETTPPPSTVDFTIGDKTYTETEYQGILSKFLEKNKLDPDYLDKTTPEMLKQQLRVFVNLEEGGKSLNERNQEFSRLKKDLMTKGEQVESIFKTAKETLEELVTEKAELAKKVKTDGEIEQLEFSEQSLAKMRNERTQDKLKDIEKQIIAKQEYIQGVKDAAVRNAYNLAFAVIQSEIPELQLDKHVLQIIRDEQEGIELDENKIIRAYAVYNLANDVMREVNQRKELREPLEKFVIKYYNRNKYKYGNFASTAQPVTENKVNPPIDKNEAIKNYVLKIKQAQQNNPPPPRDTSIKQSPGAGQDQSFDTIERNRDKMIERVYGKNNAGAYPKF